MTLVKNYSISQLHRLTLQHLWLLSRSQIHKMRHLSKLKKTKKLRMLSQFRPSIQQQLWACEKHAEILLLKREIKQRIFLTLPI